MPDEAICEEYHLVYQLMDKSWRNFDTVGGRIMVFPTLGEMESVARHIISMDGIIGGIVVNQNDTVVQRWEAKEYHGEAVLVEGKAEDAVTACN